MSATQSSNAGANQHGSHDCAADDAAAADRMLALDADELVNLSDFTYNPFPLGRASTEEGYDFNPYTGPGAVNAPAQRSPPVAPSANDFGIPHTSDDVNAPMFDEATTFLDAPLAPDFPLSIPGATEHAGNSLDISDGPYSSGFTAFFPDDPFELTLNPNGNHSASMDLASLHIAEEPQSKSQDNSMASTTMAATSATAHLQSESYLISPSLTNNSSPMVKQDSRNLPDVRNHDTAAASDRYHDRMASDSELSNGRLAATAQVAAPPVQLLSPIVRVQNFGWDDPPSENTMFRSSSKRSHGSRQSVHLLSPYLDEDPSSDESSDREEVQTSFRAAANSQRNDDGSWIMDRASGHAGIGPEARQQLNEASIPTLEEQEDQRLAAEKKAEVQEWLSKSDIIGDTAQDHTSTVQQRARASRRRATSTSGIPNHQTVNDWAGAGFQTLRVNQSNVPGPGLLIDENSQDDGSSIAGTSSEAVPESPPAEVKVDPEVIDSHPFASTEELQHITSNSTLGTPWVDHSDQTPPTLSGPYQPPTSSAAMMRFCLRARELDAVSRSATMGSRRLSESDLETRIAESGFFPLGRERSKDKEDGRGSFLENLLPKRGSGSVLKRKVSDAGKRRGSESRQSAAVETEKKTGIMRRGSRGRIKPSKADSGSRVDAGGIVIGNSPTPPAPSSPWAQAKIVMKRTRSRSDANRSHLTELLKREHGGPPVLTIVPQPGDYGADRVSPQVGGGQDDEYDEHLDDETFTPAGITMDLQVRSEHITPTLQGFRQHACRLNPRLDQYMIERTAQEQMGRYRRLVELKTNHLQRVENRKCSSTFCFALGGNARPIALRGGGRDSETVAVSFTIASPGSGEGEDDPSADGTTVAAQFPTGIPNPPVKHLPAEFECPLCFKVKKFLKPSDWTKHVHEDVQPFTCTFPNCQEPKSFKRKADWVRHENERHRQLEKWTCSYGECTHVCFRKDNFVQHLVREHKLPEPKTRTGKSANASPLEPRSQFQDWSFNMVNLTNPTPTASSDEIWAFVERCRQDTDKLPKDERCRFCGNICSTWKKLTGHLAKHMEQIALPVLDLLDQDVSQPEGFLGPLDDYAPNNLSPSVGQASEVGIDSSVPPETDIAEQPQQWQNTAGSFQKQPMLQTGFVPSQAIYAPAPQQFASGYPPSQLTSNAHPARRQSPYGMKTYPGYLNTMKHAAPPSGKLSPPTNAGVMTNNMAAGYPTAPTGDLNISIGNSPLYHQQQVFQSPVDAFPPPCDSAQPVFLPSNHAALALSSGVAHGNMGHQFATSVAPDQLRHVYPNTVPLQQRHHFPYPGGS